MSTPSTLIETTSPLVRRLWWLGRTEFTLFWRNKTAVITALLLPAVMVTFYARVDESATGGMSVNAYMLTGVVAFMLLFVVYYNLVTAYVARREELVLKRLRTGEARDWEILVASALPAAAIALAQAAIAVGIGALLLDLPAPVNVIVLLLGLFGGIVVFALLAAASTSFTRSVEFAQISTLPVVTVCVIGSGALIPLEALPEPFDQVLRFVPLAPVVELLRLGWAGAADAQSFGHAFGQALAPLAILVTWVLVGLTAVRSTFRWEPRRS
jgi:ABC-2 type transport system permease protein